MLPYVEEAFEHLEFVHARNGFIRWRALNIHRHSCGKRARCEKREQRLNG